MLVKYLGPSPARMLPTGVRVERGGEAVEVPEVLGEKVLRAPGSWAEAKEAKKTEAEPKTKEGVID